MKRRALVLSLALILLGAGGCWRWTRVTPPVTEAEARAYLDKIVAAAMARDFDRLCNLNGAVLNCKRTLDDGMRRALPSEPPTVTGTRYHPKRSGGTAGRVLVVEGRTSCAKPYRTEVFVFRENRYHFKATNAVFWSNFTFGTGPDVTLTDNGPPSSCP